MTTLFDASVHLGQFSLSDNDLRIACKNAQALLATKGQAGMVGVCTFNENSRVDHLIWDLQREEQDVFYPFMDVFHSVKDIQRIALNNEDMRMALLLADSLHINASNALTCAVAARLHVPIIHTLYPELLAPAVVQSMKESHGVIIQKPDAGTEAIFPESTLEQAYQNALQFFRQNNLDLLQILLHQK